MADEASKPSFVEVVKALPANFWHANVMELLERLAFYSTRAVAPLYLVKQANENGLGLSYADKGDIYMWWALIQCLVPMVSGGFTDRYGYKKSLYVAFTINILGYLGMAYSLPITHHIDPSGTGTAGYWVFLAAACLVGFGTAIFKPPVQGVVAKTTDEKSASMGWGLFYWVVNIGGALAPMLAARIRGEVDWQNVFFAAAIVTACNFLPAIFLFKEPPKDEPKGPGEAAGGGGERQRGPLAVFTDSILTIFKDPRLVVFLLIFSCFWLMFMQLWDLMPNFIDEWVDTSDVAPIFAWVSDDWVLGNGQVKPEMIIELNPLSIIALVIPLSWLVGRINKVAAMVIGMVISTVGLVAAGATSIGWFVCVMILLFTVGEMTCSPTFQAYIGLIAPKDKKALYMGYANIPFAIGWAAGNKIGGNLYESMASKFELARQYMIEKLGMSAELVADKKMLPNDQVMDSMSFVAGGGDAGLLAERVKLLHQQFDWEHLTKDQATAALDWIYATVLPPADAAANEQATRMLWDMHQPYMVWYVLGAIGLAGTIGMIAFYFITRKKLSGAKTAKEQAG